MILIADSSALIALACCDCLSVLESMFGSVKVPIAVFEEVSGLNKPYAQKLAVFLVDKVVSLEPHDLLEISGDADLGELEAMALYKRLQADLLLLDDRRARKLALLNGIRVVGSLGVMLRAKEQMLIPEIAPLIAVMRANGIYISQELVKQILQIAGERHAPESGTDQVPN